MTEKQPVHREVYTAAGPTIKIEVFEHNQTFYADWVCPKCGFRKNAICVYETIEAAVNNAAINSICHGCDES